jgi:DeoR/GlpR family transcriptional regulator of sugar metabolism
LLSAQNNEDNATIGKRMQQRQNKDILIDDTSPILQECLVRPMTAYHSPTAINTQRINIIFFNCKGYTASNSVWTVKNEFKINVEGSGQCLSCETNP